VKLYRVDLWSGTENSQGYKWCTSMREAKSIAAQFRRDFVDEHPDPDIDRYNHKSDLLVAYMAKMSLDSMVTSKTRYATGIPIAELGAILETLVANGMRLRLARPIDQKLSAYREKSERNLLPKMTTTSCISPASQWKGLRPHFVLWIVR